MVAELYSGNYSKQEIVGIPLIEDTMRENGLRWHGHDYHRSVSVVLGVIQLERQAKINFTGVRRKDLGLMDIT